MSQPPTYNRSTSFSNYQAANPTSPPSGSAMDVEFNNVKATLDATLANLKLIQRDDGAVASASIGLAQLSSAVTIGFSVPTAWATAKAYVSSPASTVFNGGKFYSCLISHTSGTFATDLAALKWVLIADLTAIPLVAANQIAVTPSGNLTTDVQGSLQAIDAAKAATSHTHVSSAISDSTADGRAFLTATLASQKTLLGLGSLAFLSTIPVTAITANLAFTGKITPAALAGTTNDWTPTGWATAAIVAASSSSNILVTGFGATSDGDIKVIDNVGSNGLIILPNNAGSAAANRISMSHRLVLKGGQSLVIKYDGANSLWRPISPLATNPPAGAFKNLICGNVAGPQSFAAPVTPTLQYALVADSLVVEDTSGETHLLRAVSVMADLSVGPGVAGGVDTGAAPINNTGYYFWVVYNAATDTISALWSTSATAPTMPSGYTFKARCSWGHTNGSAQLARVLQQGRNAQYVVSATVTTALPSIASGVSGSVSVPTWTAVSTAALVPATAVAVRVSLSAGTSGSGGAIAAPNNLYGNVSSASNPPPLGSNGSGGSGAINSAIGYFILESVNIYYASVVATGLMQVMGWEDNI